MLVKWFKIEFTSTLNPKYWKALFKFNSNDTAAVCIMPMIKEATKAPFIDPKPPVTTTTKTIGPSKSAIEGSVPITLPAITPAKPAKPHPKPKTLLKTLGTLCPKAATISGLVSDALIIRPVLVFDNTLYIAKY